MRKVDALSLENWSGFCERVTTPLTRPTIPCPSASLHSREVSGKFANARSINKVNENDNKNNYPANYCHGLSIIAGLTSCEIIHCIRGASNNESREPWNRNGDRHRQAGKALSLSLSTICVEITHSAATIFFKDAIRTRERKRRRKGGMEKTKRATKVRGNDRVLFTVLAHCARSSRYVRHLWIIKM